MRGVVWIYVLFLCVTSWVVPLFLTLQDFVSAWCSVGKLRTIKPLSVWQETRYNLIWVFINIISCCHSYPYNKSFLSWLFRFTSPPFSFKRNMPKFVPPVLWLRSCRDNQHVWVREPHIVFVNTQKCIHCTTFWLYCVFNSFQWAKLVNLLLLWHNDLVVSEDRKIRIFPCSKKYFRFLCRKPYRYQF